MGKTSDLRVGLALLAKRGLRSNRPGFKWPLPPFSFFSLKRRNSRSLAVHPGPFVFPLCPLSFFSPLGVLKLQDADVFLSLLSKRGRRGVFRLGRAAQSSLSSFSFPLMRSCAGGRPATSSCPLFFFPPPLQHMHQKGFAKAVL